MTLNSIPTKDIMITAWNLTSREPVFLTKESNHNISLLDSAWLSANIPQYFKPAELNNNNYISGDSVAVSPALFAV